MGLIKFITVFDDEKQLVFSETVLKRYNISAYPTVFFSDDKAYYDGLNSNADEFMHLKKNQGVAGPQIPSKVFQSAFLRAYNEGYFKVVVVCPHSKWFPYYKNAIAAVNRLKQSKTLDFSTFGISVIDSKSFSSGVLLYTLAIARQYEIYRLPSDIVVDYGKKHAVKNKSLILLKSTEAFGECCDELTAFRSFGYKFEKLHLSDSHDNVKLDMFADAVCADIKKGSRRYAVSLGVDCDFAGYVLGRIEKLSGIMPVCVMQYGIASADVFGNSAICINIFD